MMVICLQIPTTFEIGRRTTFLSYFMCKMSVMLGRNATAEPLVPGPSNCEDDIATAKLEKYKSPGRDQIPAERETGGGEGGTLVASVHTHCGY
jgi:hypothetical protein